MSVRVGKVVCAVVVALVCGVPRVGSGHPGGLNAEGCHNNRKTGGYHCHRAPARGADSDVETYYANCAEVRAAGKAPLRRGQPGYAAHLDRDGDGVACE